MKQSLQICGSLSYFSSLPSRIWDGWMGSGISSHVATCNSNPSLPLSLIRCFSGSVFVSFPKHEMATDARDEISRIEDGEVTGAGVEETQEPDVKMQWGQIVEIDDGYLQASKFTRFYRSVLFQMILFGA
jgi:hypothetical protein